VAVLADSILGGVAGDFPPFLDKQGCNAYIPTAKETQILTWLDTGTGIYVVSCETRRKRDHRLKATKGKFGRYLVELFGDTGDGVINLNQEMIRLGHAVPY